MLCELRPIVAHLNFLLRAFEPAAEAPQVAKWLETFRMNGRRLVPPGGVGEYAK